MLGASPAGHSAGRHWTDGSGNRRRHRHQDGQQPSAVVRIDALVIPAGTIGRGRGTGIPATLSNVAASPRDDFAPAAAAVLPQSRTSHALDAMFTGPVAGVVGLTEPTWLRGGRLSEQQSQRQEHADAQLLHGNLAFAAPQQSGLPGALAVVIVKDFSSNGLSAPLAGVDLRTLDGRIAAETGPSRADAYRGAGAVAGPSTV